MVSAQLNLGAVLHMMASVNLLVIDVAVCYMLRHCAWYSICWCLLIGFVPSRVTQLTMKGRKVDKTVIILRWHSLENYTPINSKVS